MAEAEVHDIEDIPQAECYCNGNYRKRSRENTVEEKRAMKKARKKRRCKKVVEELKAECEKLKQTAVRSNMKYAGMSRTYWERWQWELQERRRLIGCEQIARKNFKKSIQFVLPRIDPSMLENPPVNGESKECYAGRGSFGIVRVCLFRDIKVVVKEFLPRTLREDVIKEAHILSSLCHPYLPLFLGVCIRDTPLRIVMKYHETNGKSTTLFQEIRSKKLNSSDLVFGFCVQLMEALHYLHSEVEILHNDITTNNIVIEEDHIILIDFGKATKFSEARRYNLGETEKQELLTKYPHLAPEVVYGQQRQSVYSDVYAAGLILYHICDHCIISQPLKQSLKLLAERCRAPQFSSRPKSNEALKHLQHIDII